MHLVKKLSDDLNNPQLSTGKRYPELLDAPAGNIKILYLGTLLNKAGLYRCILPKLELQKHGYSVIINSIMRDYDGNNFIEHYDLKVKKDLIVWANLIILPAITDNIAPLVDDIKKINKYAAVAMDMDRNYHRLPPNSTEGVFYATTRQRQLIDNLSRCDAILVADSSIEEFYQIEIQKNHPEAKPNFVIFGNYLSLHLFDDIIKEQKNQNQELETKIPKPAPKNPIFNLLLYSDPVDYSDINSNREVYNWLLRTYPQVKLTVFGNPSSWKNKIALRDVQHTFIASKNIFEYTRQLHALQPDAAFVPINRNENCYRANIKLLELCSLGIPIITYHIPPYSNFDTVVQCGVTRKNIQEIFNEVMKEPKAIQNLGDKAHAHVWGNCSYESAGIINHIKEVLK